MKSLNRPNIFIRERIYEHCLRLYVKHIEPVAETFAFRLKCEEQAAQDGRQRPGEGGALNDRGGRRAIRVGGFLIGLSTVLGLLLWGSLGWDRKPVEIAPEM